MKQNENFTNEEYLETVGQVMTFFRYLRKNRSVDPVSGLSGRKCAVLLFLKSEGPCGLGKISSNFFISPSTASELVDTLQEKGLIQRSRSPQDNRKVFVSLTEVGQTTAERVKPSGKWLMRQRLKEVSPEQLAQVRTVFELLHQLTGDEDA